MFAEKKNAFMRLNRFKIKNNQKVFCEIKHFLPSLENVKNSWKANAQDLIFTKSNKESVFTIFCLDANDERFLKKDVQ